MSFVELNAVMTRNYDIESTDISNYCFQIEKMNFMQLRDRLYRIGQVLYEDQNEKIYLINLKGGFLNKNTTLAGFQLLDNFLYVSLFSKEGIIGQHTNEGVINEIRKQFRDVISCI